MRTYRGQLLTNSCPYEVFLVILAGNGSPVLRKVALFQAQGYCFFRCDMK